MVRELNPIEVTSTLDLLRLAEQVRTTGISRVLTRADEEIAIISPVKPRKSAKRAPRKTGIIAKSDPLWNILGIGASEEPTDIATHKHAYLAEAYAARHE